MKKIFIFEDNNTLLDMYKIAFESEKYHVVTSSNGKNAVEKVIQEHPDLILLDIMIPDGNGLEILQHLKQHDQTKHIPVFLNSNLHATDILKEGMSLGAYKYFVKNETDPSDLLATANKLLK